MAQTPAINLHVTVYVPEGSTIVVQASACPSTQCTQCTLSRYGGRGQGEGYFSAFQGTLRVPTVNTSSKVTVYRADFVVQASACSAGGADILVRHAAMYSSMRSDCRAF